ncbi:ROK family protein [Kitasatospora sp. NPDC049285]|uniref:ROK family protein n=1 Tax=Kitasatospora sp. NPDC049285 TaxID=3157096 RepID=UPI00343645D9
MTTPQPGRAGSNLTGLRDHNDALVLGLLRGAGEGSSRVELAAATGLTPQAVGKITARLLDDGMITEAGQAASTGGKPRTLLRLRGEAACAVGVHLERDELTVLLVDLTGRHHYRHAQPLDPDLTPPEVLPLVVAQIERAVAAAPRGARLLGAGVGCRGPLDHARGVLHWFGRPGVRPRSEWQRYPLRERLAERLDGLPVVVDKDTNAAILAETRAPGLGRSLAYVHLAGGLGAGLVLDGALYRGTRTNAGEFGHQTVQLDGPLCDCGNRGCLEALCLAELRRGDHEAVARLVGVGVANLVRLLDIDHIVLGGRAVLDAPATYTTAVAAQLRARIPEPDWQPVPVTPATTGSLAVALGAAELLLGPLLGRRV